MVPSEAVLNSAEVDIFRGINELMLDILLYYLLLLPSIHNICMS